MNKNKLLLRLFSDKERYADLINGFAGAPIVHAEDLSESFMSSSVQLHGL